MPTIPLVSRRAQALFWALATLVRAATTVDSTTHPSYALTPTIETAATTAFRNSSARASATYSQTCSSECLYVPIGFWSSTWEQYVFPTTVGTAVIVIDPARNVTSTTTRYDTEVVVSGTTITVSSLLSDGTLGVTQGPTTTNTNYAVVGLQSTPVAYPTEFFQIDSSINWIGTIPYVSDGSTVCSSFGGQITPSSPLPDSPLPMRTPSPLPVGTVDPNDPFGLWYTLNGYFDQEVLSAYNLSTYFPNDPFLSAIYNCSTGLYAEPATAVQTVASLLLATSTSYLSAPSAAPSARPAPSGLTGSPSPTIIVLPDSVSTSPPGAAITLGSPSASALPPATARPPVDTGAGVAVSDVSQTQGGSQGEPRSSPVVAATPSPSCGVACYITLALGSTGVVPPPDLSTPQDTYVVDGQTLTPGSTVTVDGTTYFVQTSGTGVYVNGLPTELPTAGLSTGQTPEVQTAYVVSGQTLIPGSTLTIGDTTYVLPTSGSGVYVNGLSTGLSAVGTEVLVSKGSTTRDPIFVTDVVDSSTPGAGSTESPRSSDSGRFDPQTMATSTQDQAPIATESSTARLLGTNSSHKNWQPSSLGFWIIMLILHLV